MLFAILILTILSFRTTDLGDIKYNTECQYFEKIGGSIAKETLEQGEILWCVDYFDFLDSIAKVAKKIYMEDLRKRKQIKAVVCNNDIELKGYGSYRPPIYFLRKQLESTNKFYFTENVVGASMLKFNVLIDRNGTVQKLIFTSKKYVESITLKMQREIEDFIKTSFYKEGIYPKCRFKGNWELIEKKEFIAVRWR